jgi:hypothetical protein
LQHVFLHVAAVFDDVVGVEEGEQGPAVAFEEAELFGERVDLIEIEPEIKDLDTGTDAPSARAGDA